MSHCQVSQDLDESLSSPSRLGRGLDGEGDRQKILVLQVFDRCVLVRVRFRSISACPSCVLVVTLGQTQKGFGTGTGSRSFHLFHIIITL
jgi:hypothetical protein